MNYNANIGGRQPLGRKLKRVSDVNAMGYNSYDTSNSQPQSNIYPNLEDVNSFQTGYPSNSPYGTPAFSASTPKISTSSTYNYNQTQYTNTPTMIPGTPNLSVLSQPVVQDMALQYGQQLAGAGKNIIKNEVEKIVPVTKLKYYFAVDTSYVVSKLMLLFFPFTHKDWSIKFEQDGPVQPRFEINAPDLYIPTMAYITYVLVAGLVLGMQQRFSPEQIGILASSALAWCIVELAVYTCTLYIIQIKTSIRTFDLLAYSGYKFVGIIISIFISIVAGTTGYYVCLVYFNLALAFFLVRSLKVQVLNETPQTNYYGGSPPTSGHKRRKYFLLFVAGIQPILSWWLSYHLIIKNAT